MLFLDPIRLLILHIPRLAFDFSKYVNKTMEIYYCPFAQFYCKCLTSTTVFFPENGWPIYRYVCGRRHPVTLAWNYLTQNFQTSNCSNPTLLALNRKLNIPKNRTKVRIFSNIFHNRIPNFPNLEFSPKNISNFRM